MLSQPFWQSFSSVVYPPIFPPFSFRMFGAEACSFISVDDKSRVPIGLTAAHKQAPLMMHLEYEVKLPDHDFVKASRHKLIPSVNAICDIGPDGEVTYSGAYFH